MTSLENTETISRLELEQWASGTLSDERTAFLEARRLHDPDLSARMDRVQAEIRSASIGMPALRLPEESAAPSFWAQLWAQLVRPPALLAVGIALALALIAVRPGLLDDDYVGTRGVMNPPMQLEVVRVRNGVVAPQDALIQAQQGDRIQYAVSVPAPDLHMAVYNLQDNGALQVYLESRPVKMLETVEGAVILDDYQGSERIFFVLDDAPITRVQIEGAIQKAYQSPLADLDVLPVRFIEQRSVLIVKAP
ncbi:MAG: hypothetical protein AAFV53_25955 [Myxococcota bacterium]